MSGDGKLPPRWACEMVGEVCLSVEKVAPKDNPDKPFIYIDIASIDNSSLRITQPKTYLGKEAPSRARQRIAAGDTLLSTVRTYLRNIALVPLEFDGEIASTGFCVLRPSAAVQSPFLFYAVQTDDFISALNPLQRGTSYPAVRNNDVMAQRIPLPPLPEQCRIVAEIEKHFTRLDAAVASLQRAKANLKRYRASVLRAACEGRLAPTEAALARREGREYEHASVLLERILKERRGQWEAEERRRGKYRDPQPPDTGNLPTLPEGWAWATVDQAVVRSEYGTSVKCTYEANGLPVLRIPNIVAGEIDFSDLKYATVALIVGAQAALQLGDILMCRTNGSVSLIGKTAVVRSPLELPHTFASYLLRFRLGERDTLPLWLHICLSSLHGRAFIESHAASSAGQHNVSLTLIHGMPFPLPPLAEQRRIVAEVERHLSVIQAAENIVAANQKRAERLRQAILQRAFQGKLVPQDPTGEPASALLERIRAERGTADRDGGRGLGKSVRRQNHKRSTDVMEGAPR